MSSLFYSIIFDKEDSAPKSIKQTMTKINVWI